MRLRDILIITLVAAMGTVAGAQGLHGGVTRPLRLTAGASNQFMGVLAPDGRTLYFVTDRHATYEIYRQNIVNRSGGRVMDLDADVTDPQIDRSGKRLLFISFRNDAGGDACIKNLDTGKIHCLTGPDTSDLQAFFFPDGKRVGVLQRTDLHSDLRLVSIPVQGGKPRLILRRNMTGPSISPDGRFLLFVPIERLVKAVGVTFAVKAGKGFEVLNLQSGQKTVVKPNLPGRTSFPVFSRDEHAIYFTQYLDDTNKDGLIDGNDNGVIFKVPFDPKHPQKTAHAMPVQLTSAAWNCQYPFAAADKLIMTCARAGSLDIYSMPLCGAVPANWDKEKVWEEVWASRDAFEMLLLLYRAAAMEKDLQKRIEIYRRMAFIHMDHRDFESARFYIDQVRRQAQRGVARDWAAVFSEVLAHRVAQARPDRDEAIEVGRARRLADFVPAGPDGKALAALARSEVLEDLGRRQEAQQVLEGLDLRSFKDFATVLYAARRFEEFFGPAGERQPVLKALAVLVQSRAIPLLDRLFLADRYTKWLLRGRSYAERSRLIRAAIKDAGAHDQVLKYRLRVAGLLLGVGKQDPETIRKALFKLYKSDRNVQMRKVLVQNTALASARKDQAYLLYQFSNSWVSFLRKRQAERKYAEDLYRETVLERAYDALAKGNIGDARGSFFGVTLQTDSLEAHIGFIEAGLKEGKDVAAYYRRKYKGHENAPVYLFVKAYMAARQLGDSSGARFEKLARTAVEDLSKAAQAFDSRAVFHMVFGFVAHQQYLHTHDTAKAAQAISHYLLALDLGRNNPRVLARVYMELGLLQAALGNYDAAMREFRTRLRYPFVDATSRLVATLGLAGCGFMLGHNRTAVDAVGKAVKLLEAHKSLDACKGFILDRAALYNLTAGHYAKALSFYRKLARLMGPHARTDHVARLYLATGSAALGAGKCGLAVDELGKAAAALRQVGVFAPRVRADWGGGLRPAVFDRNDLLALDYGLLSAAWHCRGNDARAMAAMKKRLALLRMRFKRRDADQDLLEIASTDLKLARLAVAMHQPKAAARYISLGVAAHDKFAKRSGTNFTRTLSDLVGLAARLHFQSHAGLDEFSFDLHKKVNDVYEFIKRYRNPKWADVRDVFMVYSTMFNLEGGKR